ncbi:Hypothetical predicted protein, partial [Olea europaea subsp. europaea]
FGPLYCSNHHPFYCFVPLVLLLPEASGELFLARIAHLYYYYLKHLVNYFWLGLLTTTVGFMVGFTCAFSSVSKKVGFLLKSLS